MTSTRDLLAIAQIGLVGGFLVWALQPGSSGPSDLGLGLATIALGLSAVLGEVLLRHGTGSVLARVGRQVAIGAFVVAAAFSLFEIGLEVLVPAAEL